MKKQFSGFIVLLLLSCWCVLFNPASVLACGCGSDYRLDPENSTLQFVSIKDGKVEVPGTFKTLSGKLRAVTDETGKTTVVTGGSIKVKITSLDTGLEARDNNLRRYFFELDKKKNYRFASFIIDKPIKVHLKKKQQTATLRGTLSLHGRKGVLEIPVTIYSKNEGLRIQTKKPISLEFVKWSFYKAVAKLMQVCGHQELRPFAEVTFDIRFTPCESATSCLPSP